MPRPPRPLDATAGPIQAFAADLRKLRLAAGDPKYLQMARRTGKSRTALAEAAGGDHLPTWETVAAFVTACGSDPAIWRPKWERVRDQVRGNDQQDGARQGSVSEQTDPDAGWHVESFSALVKLDATPIEVVETRTVIADIDGVHLLGTSVGVPRHPADSDGSHSLDVELLYGGRLVERRQLSESRFRHVIELPTTLSVSEPHRYSLRLLIPRGQLMAPHYVHTPKRRTDYFELRVRFNPSRLPSKVWRLDKVPTTVIYERQPVADLLLADRFGEAYAAFSNLEVGYGYGISWQEAKD